MSYHTLYTFGYLGSSLDDLQRYLEALNAVLVDIRFSPWAKAPEWGQRELQRRLGRFYRHMKALGNENYKGGEIKLHAPEAAIAPLAAILRQRPAILLCACPRASTCHRRDAAELLASRLGLLVEHLPGRFARWSSGPDDESDLLSDLYGDLEAPAPTGLRRRAPAVAGRVSDVRAALQRPGGADAAYNLMINTPIDWPAYLTPAELAASGWAPAASQEPIRVELWDRPAPARQKREKGQDGESLSLFESAA